MGYQMKRIGVRFSSPKDMRPLWCTNLLCEDCAVLLLWCFCALIPLSRFGHGILESTNAQPFFPTHLASNLYFLTHVLYAGKGVGEFDVSLISTDDIQKYVV